ncbi:hypothetical protein HDK64DRAFT_260224, partial [Phyllosticta capitalensis]
MIILGLSETLRSRWRQHAFLGLHVLHWLCTTLLSRRTCVGPPFAIIHLFLSCEPGFAFSPSPATVCVPLVA